MTNESSDNTTIETNSSVLSLNMKNINMNTRTECPICFDTIVLDDPILILDCCSKIVHLSCILEWYSNRPNNKLCFMCNQSNNFCKDLIYNEYISEPDSDHNIESEHNNNEAEHNNELVQNTELIVSYNSDPNIHRAIINTRITTSNHKYYIFCIISCIGIFSVSCWVIIFLIKDAFN